MATTINLRPIQTGDACYLTDHHNRPGECIITVTMSDAVPDYVGALAELHHMLTFSTTLGLPAPASPHRCANPADLREVVNWCDHEWQLAQADMPAAADRDSAGGDESERYLNCHILATWEV
jgi:hypothetical protein